MTCVADEVLAAWVEGVLAEPERAAAILHAVTCVRCRELVGELFAPVGRREPITIGRYEVLGTLAGGGMGVVLRGRDPVLERAVAIKLANVADDDPQQHARMLREAQALARLSHPNVVAVYDCGESGGEVFVAMALVDGIPLSRWLAEPRSLADRRCVLGDVAGGLAAIHDAGLVHRDIKPDNIMVQDNGRALIVDFGLARVAALGAGSGIAGTPSYLAPEVMTGGPASPASDQFAWWVLVSEVLRDAELPERADLDRAIARGTGVVGERFSDLHEAAAVLRSVADEKHAEAPSRAPSRRTRWIVAGGAVAIAAAATVVGVVVLQQPDATPCAWSPTAWTTARARISTTVAAAGGDAPRVLAAFDRRAAETRTARAEACELAAAAVPESRALGQNQLACIDRTWADAIARLRELGSNNRDDVWAGLDGLALVLAPERCRRGAAHAFAAPPLAGRAAEVSRLNSELEKLVRDSKLDSPARLARADALGPAISATEHASLIARWRVIRAGYLAQLGKLEASAAELDRGELAAEASGDDDLRTEIAIDRLTHAYSSGQHDTAALEAHATALVEKLDNPVRRAELADARAMLLSARGDAAGAVGLLREVVALYDGLALDASERAVRSLQNLGAALQLAEDLDAAQAVFDRGLVVARRRFGEAAPDTLEMRGARATNLLYRGQSVEAQRELAAVVDGLARGAGTGDRALLMAQLMLCQTETELRSNTAIQRCRAALAGAEAANGTDHPQLVAFLNLLGNALRVGDHAREAVDVLSRALAIAEHGAISPDELVYARAYFALALHRADPRDPRAEVAARQAAEPLAKLSGGDSLRDELVAAFPRLLRP